MKVCLNDIACARSGDKGANSNVGLVFKNKALYDWAISNITEDLVKDYFKTVVRGKVVRYELPNINSFNFILYNSLRGGGSDTLINDAQGKTHGQIILMMEVDVPDNLL